MWWFGLFLRLLLHPFASRRVQTIFLVLLPTLLFSHPATRDSFLPIQWIMAANSSRPPGQDHHNEKKASAVPNLTPDITPALNAPKPSIRHAPPPGLSNLPPNTLLYPIELPGVNFMNADDQRGAVFAAAAAAAAVLSGISPDAIDTTPRGIAAPCNRPDCLVCSTFNNPTSALHELPQINIGEFWIRHIVGFFDLC